MVLPFCLFYCEAFLSRNMKEVVSYQCLVHVLNLVWNMHFTFVIFIANLYSLPKTFLSRLTLIGAILTSMFVASNVPTVVSYRLIPLHCLLREALTNCDHRWRVFLISWKYTQNLKPRKLVRLPDRNDLGNSLLQDVDNSCFICQDKNEAF